MAALKSVAISCVILCFMMTREVLARQIVLHVGRMPSTILDCRRTPLLKRHTMAAS